MGWMGGSKCRAIEQISTPFFLSLGSAVSLKVIKMSVCSLWCLFIYLLHQFSVVFSPLLCWFSLPFLLIVAALPFSVSLYNCPRVVQTKTSSPRPSNTPGGRHLVRKKKRKQQTNPNTDLLSLSLLKAIVCCLWCNPPGDLLHTGQSACLLNISQGETLKIGLLSCDGTVRMDKPICWEKRAAVTQRKLCQVLQPRRKCINNEIFEFAGFLLKYYQREAQSKSCPIFVHNFENIIK